MSDSIQEELARAVGWWMFDDIIDCEDIDENPEAFMPRWTATRTRHWVELDLDNDSHENDNYGQRTHVTDTLAMIALRAVDWEQVAANLNQRLRNAGYQEAEDSAED